MPLSAPGPLRRVACITATAVRRADSSGRRNTLKLEVAMSIRERRSARSGRAPLPSSGRPPAAGRDEQIRFWRAITTGLSSEDAALEAGVSQPVGTRWFRKAGGMPPAMFRSSAKPLSGRYLSLVEREEIALLRVQGYSIQAIGRRLGRAASTISRELRRNAGHPQRRVGVSGKDCAVACRWVGPSAQTDQACTQHGVARLCGGETCQRRHGPERRSGPWSCRSVEGPPAWSAKGSEMGSGLEPGADCPTVAGRLP